MHKIKKWMTKDHWFDEESNQEIRSFICQDFVFEDPVWQNNPQNAIQLNFTSIPKRKRSSFVVGFLHELLNGKDFFLCEYGSIGISDKKKLIKGHPSKEHCFEFQGFNEDIDYLYHNVTYIKVRAGQLNIRHFVRSVFKRVCPACNYYLIDLIGMMGIRLYDERGCVIVAKDKKKLEELSDRYSKFLSYHFE